VNQKIRLISKFSSLLFIFFVCFIVSKAEAVEIQLTSYESTKAKGISALDNMGAVSEKKVALQFEENHILIKSDKLDMVVNFDQEIIFWRDRDKGITSQGPQYSFDYIRNRGANISEYFVAFDRFAQDKQYKKKREDIAVGPLNVTMWKKKIDGNNFIETWTLSGKSETGQIYGLVKQLVDKTGIIIAVSGTADWFRSILELEATPALIYISSRTELPYGIARIKTIKFVAIERMDNQTLLDPQSIQELINQRPFVEKILIKMKDWSETMTVVRLLIPTIIILALVASPFWYPGLMHLIVDRKADKSAKKDEYRNDIIKLYNTLNKLNASWEGKINLGDLSAERASFRKFIESPAYKKLFRKGDKKELQDLIRKLNEDAAMKNISQGTIKKLMTRCDKIIGHHLSP